MKRLSPRRRHPLYGKFRPLDSTGSGGRNDERVDKNTFFANDKNSDRLHPKQDWGGTLYLTASKNGTRFPLRGDRYEQF